MAGAELEREEKAVRDLRAQGRAVKMDIDTNFRVRRATETEAVLDDEYLNRSVVIDAATKQPLATPGPPPTERVSFQFRKLDGVWKVVDGVRYE